MYNISVSRLTPWPTFSLNGSNLNHDSLSGEKLCSIPTKTWKTATTTKNVTPPIGTLQFIISLSRSGAQDSDSLGHARVCQGGLQRRHPLHRWLLRIWAVPHQGCCRGAGGWEGNRAPWIGETRNVGCRSGDAHQTLGQSQVIHNTVQVYHWVTFAYRAHRLLSPCFTEGIVFIWWWSALSIR